jgi:hypothetical protein
MPRGGVGFDGEDRRDVELSVLGTRVFARDCFALCEGKGLVWHERAGVVLRRFCRARQLARMVDVVDCNWQWGSYAPVDLSAGRAGGAGGRKGSLGSGDGRSMVRDFSGWE